MIMKSSGEYKIINGKELEKIPDIKDKYFWESKGYTEEECKQFVEKSQVFFEKYVNEEDCYGYRIGRADAMYVYVHLGNCIYVEKTKKGYKCTSNGMHRCAVARKYKLNLLVCVRE